MSIIKEFRIGNLVADYETEPHYFAIEEIGLYEDGELAVWYRNGSIMDKDPDPIPLTEEWLIKLGFERSRWDGRDYQLRLNGELYQYKVYKNGRVDCSLSSAINEKQKTFETVFINTVHKLQNLIYSLTGEELTLKNK